MPPVRMMASAPPMTVLYAPMYSATRYAHISSASSAAWQPLPALVQMSRMSPPFTPLTAWRPLCLLRSVSISAGVFFSLSMMERMAAPSMSPQRVPITRPAKGVRPMVVSTHWPPFTAARLEPLPRWQVTMFSLSSGFLRSLAASSVMNLWLVPWKPYLRMPYFL